MVRYYNDFMSYVNKNLDKNYLNSIINNNYQIFEYKNYEKSD